MTPFWANRCAIDGTALHLETILYYTILYYAMLYYTMGNGHGPLVGASARAVETPAFLVSTRLSGTHPTAFLVSTRLSGKHPTAILEAPTFLVSTQTYIPIPEKHVP